MPEIDFDHRYALETRAEVLTLVSASDAVRQGETDRTEIGGLASSDAVTGQETLQVDGRLHERSHAQLVRAARLRTQVAGKLALHTHSDTTLLGGAMAETHAGAVLLLAGMSDSLVAGGGMRVTALGDLSLAGLVGLEEKIGSAVADGALIEAYGMHFEREYGAGSHVAGYASFSGTVYTTVATGFRQLYRFATGVRNVTPGGGGAAGAEGPAADAQPPPPAPPPASAAPPNEGLLGKTPNLADEAETAGDLATVADPADVADAARNLPASADSGRSADVAEELTQARYLTNQEIDDTLARLRARAGLPDEQGTLDLYAYVHNLPHTEADNPAYRAAAATTYADIKDAIEPFQPEFGIGLRFDLDGVREFDDIGGVRDVIAANAADARVAGDIDQAAALEGTAIGFDNLVYQHVQELQRRFPDVAEVRDFQEGLNVARAPSFPPPRYDPTPLVEGFDKADVIDQLQMLRADWLEDVVPLKGIEGSVDEAVYAYNETLQTGADLFALAADEVARGNDPAAALEAQLELQRLRAGGAGIEGSLEPAEEVVEQVRQVVAAGSEAADRSKETDALLRSHQTRLTAATDTQDWETLLLLSEAQDELGELEVGLFESVETHFSDDELDALIDLREPVAVREALLTARDSANPQDALDIGAALAEYDSAVRDYLSDVLSDADALAARPTALADDVNRVDALTDLQRLQEGTAPILGRLPADDDLLLIEEDFLKAYGFAAKQIATGQDPLRGLNADIAKVQYAIRSVDPAKVDDIAALEKRVRRLQQARDLVRQALDSHRGRQAPRTVRFASAADDIAGDGWQAIRYADSLQNAPPAELRFQGEAMPLGGLLDRTQAGAAAPGLGGGDGFSLPGLAAPNPIEDSAGLSARGDYPLVARLPGDVDNDALADALIDEIVAQGLARLDRFDDASTTTRRKAFTTAATAATAGEDPVAHLDDIAAAAGTNERGAEILQEVRARVLELVDEHRLATPPVSQYDEAGAAQQVASLRRQTLVAAGEADQLASTSSRSLDYVTSWLGPPGPGDEAPTSAFEASSTSSQSLDYATSWLAPPSPGGEAITAALETRPIVEARLLAAPAQLTIRDDSPRLLGFLPLPNHPTPVVRVTPAEATAIDRGFARLQVLNTATLQPYGGRIGYAPTLANDEILRFAELSDSIGVLDSQLSALSLGPLPDAGTTSRWRRLTT